MPTVNRIKKTAQQAVQRRRTQKIDAYQYVKKDEDDLTPATRENLSLDDLKKTWMSKKGSPTLFISDVQKTNIDELRRKIYAGERKIHIKRYPYNDFLYPDPDKL